MDKSENIKAFEAWWEWLLSPGIEGGLSSSQYDKGNKNVSHGGTTHAGLTNMGVTLATYLDYAKEFGLPEDRNGLIYLTKGQHKMFAWKFWTLGRCDKMPGKVAIMHADYGWGSGTGHAAITLQRLIGVVRDGVIGPITLAKVNSILPSLLLDTLYKERSNFLLSISTGDQERHRVGWQRRNDSCYQLAKSHE